MSRIDAPRTHTTPSDTSAREGTGTATRDLGAFSIYGGHRRGVVLRPGHSGGAIFTAFPVSRDANAGCAPPGSLSCLGFRLKGARATRLWVNSSPAHTRLECLTASAIRRARDEVAMGALLRNRASADYSCQKGAFRPRGAFFISSDFLLRPSARSSSLAAGWWCAPAISTMSSRPCLPRSRYVPRWPSTRVEHARLAGSPAFCTLFVIFLRRQTDNILWAFTKILSRRARSHARTPADHALPSVVHCPLRRRSARRTSV